MGLSIIVTDVVGLHELLSFFHSVVDEQHHNQRIEGHDILDSFAVLRGCLIRNGLHFHDYWRILLEAAFALQLIANRVSEGQLVLILTSSRIKEVVVHTDVQVAFLRWHLLPVVKLNQIDNWDLALDAWFLVDVPWLTWVVWEGEEVVN